MRFRSVVSLLRRARLARTLLLVALLALAAGSMLATGCYRIDLTGQGRFLCRQEPHECPDGFRCRIADGVCVRAANAQALGQPPQDDGGSAGDAIAPD